MLGATATPKAPAPTLPSTSTLDGISAALPGDSWRIVLLSMAGILAAALLLTPARSVVRRKDDDR